MVRKTQKPEGSVSGSSRKHTTERGGRERKRLDEEKRKIGVWGKGKNITKKEVRAARS